MTDTTLREHDRKKILIPELFTIIFGFIMDESL